jgi:hypothetical protein
MSTVAAVSEICDDELLGKERGADLAVDQAGGPPISEHARRDTRAPCGWLEGPLSVVRTRSATKDLRNVSVINRL